MKEQPGDMVYALYANGSGATKVPVGEVNIGGSKVAAGPTQLAAGAWTHLATTYDGATLRLFVNGSQAAQLAIPGAIPTSTGALRLGGNTIWPEWFQGDIDEVRVYNRALSRCGDPVGYERECRNPDTQAPTAPSSLAGTGSLNSVALTWTGSTDNVA